MEESEIDLVKYLRNKINDGNDIIKRLKSVKHIDGVEKLVRKVRQEIKFLEKVHSSGQIKMEQLQSTNLIHLNAITECLLSSQNPIGVLKPFESENSKLEVDVVCCGGARWIKAIARNAKALTLISLGNGEYGQKSILAKAKSYLDCAEKHQYMYRSPKVVFHFAYGIEAPLAKELDNLGIVVQGPILAGSPTKFDESNSLDETCSDDPKNRKLSSSSSNKDSAEIRLLNLDVSTLLAYVTNMANGHANFIFQEPLLTEQAAWERERPIKPVLDEFFEGKELTVCQTAYTNFTMILDVIGGPQEVVRANELLKRVRVVEDIADGRIMQLSIGGKIKDRSRLVFATGENLKSITVSANEGFVRAARMQGVECMVFLHEPRSLSEIKERSAEKIVTKQPAK